MKLHFRPNQANCFSCNVFTAINRAELVWRKCSNKTAQTKENENVTQNGNHHKIGRRQKVQYSNCLYAVCRAIDISKWHTTDQMWSPRTGPKFTIGCTKCGYRFCCIDSQCTACDDDSSNGSPLKWYCFVRKSNVFLIISYIPIHHMIESCNFHGFSFKYLE